MTGLSVLMVQINLHQKRLDDISQEHGWDADSDSTYLKALALEQCYQRPERL